mgnify:FL=1
MKDFDKEERVEKAIKNFMSGYNCAQSVFLAYYDLFGLDFEVAKSVSVSFGGGMARMREVCGTVSAMAMLAGFKYPVADPSDQEARTRNYAAVQSLAGAFKDRFGTIICRELLPAAEAAKQNPSPSLRTAEYYAKRPCARYVEASARLIGEELKKNI